MRAQQSEPEAAKAIDATVPCPMCESPVALDATSCANCGVKFTPTRSMEDELDDLGHAAIQEMVQEELGPVKGPEKALDKPDVRAPKPEQERDVPPAKKPIEKTPSKKGLTNGLALGLGGFRWKGFPPADGRRMMRLAASKLYLIPLVVAALLLAPFFVVPDYRRPAYPIRIGGQFGDWTSPPTEAMGPGAALIPNIDV